MMTGGLGNPAVSTVENVASFAFALLAILLPVLAALGAFALLYVVIKKGMEKKSQTNFSV